MVTRMGNEFAQQTFIILSLKTPRSLFVQSFCTRNGMEKTDRLESGTASEKVIYKTAYQSEKSESLEFIYIVFTESRSSRLVQKHQTHNANIPCTLKNDFSFVFSRKYLAKFQNQAHMLFFLLYAFDSCYFRFFTLFFSLAFFIHYMCL